MNRSKRVQRKRAKGWRMPPGTIYVGRGTRWGNPYTVEEHGRERAIVLYREMMLEVKLKKPEYYRLLLSPLRGKDLACFCALDQACHADVLLQLANEEEPCQSKTTPRPSPP